MNLENIFDTAQAQKDAQNTIFINGLKKRWEQHLTGANEIFEKVEFLSKKGYKVALDNAHEFDERKARDSHYPCVRVNHTTMIYKIDSTDFDIKVSSLGKFHLMGEHHTYESFITKLVRPY